MINKKLKFEILRLLKEYDIENLNTIADVINWIFCKDNLLLNVDYDQGYFCYFLIVKKGEKYILDIEEKFDHIDTAYENAIIYYFSVLK